MTMTTHLNGRTIRRAMLTMACSMTRSRSLWMLLLTLATTICSSQPMKKAIPPLMDPIKMMPEVTHKVFLDIQIEGGRSGRILLGLFGSIAPNTVENFLSLCKCGNGKAQRTGIDMCYRNSTFHRVIPGFMIQGGDYTHHDGTGGESIHGGRNMEDETFEVLLNRRFMLAMANSGERDTNGSQFFINTVKAQWLDGKHVVFGRVLGGESIISAIEEEGTYGGKPIKKIVITDSGELELAPGDADPIPVSKHAPIL